MKIIRNSNKNIKLEVQYQSRWNSTDEFDEIFSNFNKNLILKLRFKAENNIFSLIRGPLKVKFGLKKVQFDWICSQKSNSKFKFVVCNSNEFVQG